LLFVEVLEGKKSEFKIVFMQRLLRVKKFLPKVPAWKELSAKVFVSNNEKFHS